MRVSPSGYVPKRVGLWRIAWMLSFPLVLTVFAVVMNAPETFGLMSFAMQFAMTFLKISFSLFLILSVFALIGTPLALIVMAIELSADRQMRPKGNAR